MNIFEKASRKKFRFPTNRGDLTVENLWDMPLTARDGFDLNSVAVSINNELKGVTEESFVQTTPNRKAVDLGDKLELVKFVIAEKIEAAEKAKAAKERDEKRNKLLEALGQKEDEGLRAMTKDEILEELKALEG